MIEASILRRNIERFRRMLDEETDQSTRRAIENMILEFEGMLSISELGKRPIGGDRRSPDSSEKNQRRD
jgi:divalent metal cation (Fe/Co/Zn/Cd) transporter